MNSKIINPSQYKKITSTGKERRSARIENEVRRGRVSKINTKENLFKKENSSAKKRFFTGIAVIAFMAILSIVSASIFSIEQNEYIAAVSNIETKVLDKDFNFKVAINNLDLKKNVIVNELKSLSYESILSYDENYNITLNLAENITKENNLNYTIKFKKARVNEEVKSVIEGIKTDEDHIYYSAFSKVESLDLADQYTLKVKLEEENDYFIYYLDFPVVSNSNVIARKYAYTKADDLSSITFNKVKESDSILSSITVLNYQTSNNIINDFKNGSIHMFLTSDEDDMKFLSRYDYNLKKYRDGMTYFLLPNKESELVKCDEVRKAIVYSLDRSLIAKNISTSFAEVIDVPYIYSNVALKYDTYAISNLLLSNGWKMQSGVYTKKLDTGNVQDLEIKILVNSSDKTRVDIGKMIAEMLEENSIKVDLEMLEGDKLTEAVNSVDYDYILSIVNLTKNPDISFLYNYIDVNDKVRKAIDEVKNAEVYNVAEKVNNLKDTILNEAACIGIIAKNVNVVTSKDIYGFESINYMKIFNDVSKIGK